MLLILIISAIAGAGETSPCDVSKPITIEELRTVFDSCIIPIGTTVSISIEEMESQVQRPGIGFMPNDSSLTQNGKVTLDGVVRLLSARKKLYVKVVGYADSQEQGDLVGLSYRRADSAAKYIIEMGIDPSRVHAEAGGADNRIDFTDTPEGHARNRRVEFVISVPEPVK